MKCRFRASNIAIRSRQILKIMVVPCMLQTGCANDATVRVATAADQQALIKAAAASAPNIQAGDKIKVTVFDEDRLSGEYQVDPAGFVSLPLAGTIKAAGLSKLQLEKALAVKFSGEYLRDPKVTVDIASFRPFYILGEVSKPGEYEYKSGLNVVSALAVAGGTTYRASESTVDIQHVGETNFKQYPISSNIPVLPGDLIRVPMRYF
jgi:protein involved in polysaccharide export with SLBB domain